MACQSGGSEAGSPYLFEDRCKESRKKTPREFALIELFWWLMQGHLGQKEGRPGRHPLKGN
jgi:hypothetical protein